MNDEPGSFTPVIGEDADEVAPSALLGRHVVDERVLFELPRGGELLPTAVPHFVRRVGNRKPLGRVARLLGDDGDPDGPATGLRLDGLRQLDADPIGLGVGRLVTTCL